MEEEIEIIYRRDFRNSRIYTCENTRSDGVTDPEVDRQVSTIIKALGAMEAYLGMFSEVFDQDYRSANLGAFTPRSENESSLETVCSKGLYHSLREQYPELSYKKTSIIAFLDMQIKDGDNIRGMNAKEANILDLMMGSIYFDLLKSNESLPKLSLVEDLESFD